MSYELAANTWGPEEENAILKCIQESRFTMGEKVAQFECEFAKKFGVQYATMVSSGSMANLVGVASLFFKKDNPLKPGDEVIVPAISWATTYYPLLQYGLKLKFVDIELETLNANYDQINEAITKKTKAIVAVSILGNPAPLHLLRNLCDDYGIYLFEDNCESMGAKLDDKYCGTFGHLGTFSSFFSHHISTMEGGVIVTESRELWELHRSLRAHGWTRNLPEDSCLFQRGEDDFFENYRFILPGYNARPLEISGAVGVEQLKKLDEMTRIRRQNAAYFRGLMYGNVPFYLQQEIPKAESSWFSFTLIPWRDSFHKKDIFKALQKAGIQFRMITGGNFVRHDVIKYFDYSIHGDLKQANYAHDNGFFVGNHPKDLRKELDTLHQVLKNL